MAKDPREVRESDLSKVMPSAAADWLKDRTEFALRNPLGRVNVTRETHGPSAVLVVDVVLRQGLLPGGGVAALGWALSAPAWVTVTAAAVVLVAYAVIGFVLIERAAHRQQTERLAEAKILKDQSAPKVKKAKGK